MVVSIRYFSILILEFLKQEKTTDEKHINRQLNLTSLFFSQEDTYDSKKDQIAKAYEGHTQKVILI